MRIKVVKKSFVYTDNAERNVSRDSNKVSCTKVKHALTERGSARNTPRFSRRTRDAKEETQRMKTEEDDDDDDVQPIVPIPNDTYISVCGAHICEKRENDLLCQ